MSSHPAVLVLSASPQDAAMTVRELRGLGYAVSGPVAPLELAPDRTELSRYHLIVLDLQAATLLAELDAAEQLRAALDLPILLLIPDIDIARLRDAGKVHTFDCLLKPCSATALQVNVELALARHASKLRLQSADDSYREKFSRKAALTASCA